MASLLLLVSCIASARASATPASVRQKDWFLQVELLRLGKSAPNTWGVYTSDARLLKLGVSYKRWRASTSLVSLLPITNCIFPLEVGYTIYREPQRYGPFYGMTPDVFTEAGLYVINGRIDDNPIAPAGKLAVRVEADGLGIGVGAEAALYYVPSFSPSVIPAVNADVRLVTNFGF